MRNNVEKTRRRIEAQGFVGLSDTEIGQINYWLRLAPAICLAWTATGVVLASPRILMLLVPFALLGAILPLHPFDVLYNHVIRRVTKSQRLPRYGEPRRFACLMATLMVSATAGMFAMGLSLAGYLLGAVMIVMAGVNVSTGFCVPSFIYGKLFGTRRPPSSALRPRQPGEGITYPAIDLRFL